MNNCATCKCTIEENHPTIRATNSSKVYCCDECSTQVKPRWFVNAPLSDGDCVRCYVGDDIESPIEFLREYAHESNDPWDNDRAEIWCELLSDFDVDELKEI